LNARVRTGGKVVVTCLSCGRVSRLRRTRRKIPEPRSGDGRSRVQEDAAEAVSSLDEDAEDEEGDDEPG
jgi:hypothetical protein